MIVLARAFWSFGGGISPGQKLVGQITKCQWFELTFWVRENLNGNNAYYISSAERWCEKGGNDSKGMPQARRNVLEVATLRQSEWDQAADLVRSLDHLRRPVRRHRLFTVAWAEKHLKLKGLQ